MFSLQRIRQEFARTRSGPARPPAAEHVRKLCAELLQDVDPHARDALLDRLNRLRRADDVWDLRNALFGLVSQHHGEIAARARLGEFDAGMAKLPARPAPRWRDAWAPTVT